MPQSFEDAALTCPEESSMIEINGIAHIQLTVNYLQRAMPFYEDVMGFMGMKAVVKAPNGLYMIGGRTAVAITRSSEANRKDDCDQRRIGLHHLCFRADCRLFFQPTVLNLSSRTGSSAPSRSCPPRTPRRQSYFTGIRTGASLFLSKTTRNSAGIVLLALRPTV
jgi:Glyoxalase/Bleomycin resistance protein/Dioxygenase superfamily